METIRINKKNHKFINGIYTYLCFYNSKKEIITLKRNNISKEFNIKNDFFNVTTKIIPTSLASLIKRSKLII